VGALVAGQFVARGPVQLVLHEEDRRRDAERYAEEFDAAKAKLLAG
jgi:hypothetical protein